MIQVMVRKSRMIMTRPLVKILITYSTSTGRKIFYFTIKKIQMEEAPDLPRKYTMITKLLQLEKMMTNPTLIEKMMTKEFRVEKMMTNPTLIEKMMTKEFR